MMCPTCGRPAGTDHRFCKHCGAALELTVPVLPEPIRVTPAPSNHAPVGPALRILNGPLAGTVCSLEADVTRIGRDPDSDVFLDDVTVSRRHAEIRSRPDHTFQIEDTGSLNGTYVEGTRISRTTVLSDRTHLRIGRYSIIFYGPSAP